MMGVVRDNETEKSEKFGRPKIQDEQKRILMLEYGREGTERKTIQHRKG